MFALIHFTVKDLYHLKEALGMVNHVGFALIMIWLTLNFGIVKAISLHILHNLVFMLPIVFTLQFPEQEAHSVVVDGYELTWNKTPLFTGGKTLTMTEQSAMGKGYTVKEFAHTVTEHTDGYTITKDNQYFTYNFSMNRKAANTAALSPEVIEKLLLEASLIEKE